MSIISNKYFCLNQKGIIYTFDLLLTIIIVFVILLISSMFIFDTIKEKTNQEEDFFLKEKTLAISDVLIKSNNANSFLGIAKKDIDKKRVLSNQIDLTNLQFENFELKNFFIKEIKYKTKIGFESSLYFSEKEFSNCYSIERFVLINEEKGVLSVRGCYE